MKSAQIASIATFSVMLAGASLPAHAQSVEECKARIELVQGDLDTIQTAGGIGGNHAFQTYTSLSSKLAGAKGKLDQSKTTPDALQKLEDFKLAVTTMRDAAKPKLSADDAGLLLDGDGGSDIDEGVNGAITCVALLP